MGAVDNSKHVDLIRLDVVDDSEGPFQNLPNLRDAEFHDLPPDNGNSAICCERVVRRSTTCSAYLGEFLAM